MMKFQVIQSRSPMHADRLKSLSEPVDDLLPARVACGRCGRKSDTATMRMWSERRRFRIASRDHLGGFRYEYGHRHFGVCEPCHADLSRGGRIADVRTRWGVVALLAMILAGVLMVLAVPVILPQLMSAFWQTGG
jgi:hypothetical protein